MSDERALAVPEDPLGTSRKYVDSHGGYIDSEGTLADPLPVVDIAMDELGVLLADAELARRDSDDEGGNHWLPPWYLGRLEEFKALREVIKVQCNKMLGQVAAREKALQWKWGQPFQAQVNQDLQAQGGKKKSVDYPTGRAGFRSTGGKPQLVIHDEEEALEAAEVVCPDAVTKSLRKADIKEFLASGHTLPGAELEETETQDTFYPPMGQPELAAIEQPRLPGHTEGEGHE